METAQEQILFKQYADMYSKHPYPVALFDRTMKCVHSNNEKVITAGTMLQGIAREPFALPLVRFSEIQVYLNSEFACARITPIKNDCGDAFLYICEFIFADTVLSMSAKTDAAAKVFPLFNTIEYNLSSLWKLSTELSQELIAGQEFEKLEKMFSLQQALSNISSASKNALEYVNMMFAERTPVRLDAAALMNNLCERCNAALAKCGRGVDIVCEPVELAIFADAKHAVAALVNAVQNALLYSPKDSKPIASVFCKKENSRSFVVFSITNENIMFTDKDFKKAVNVNFSYQRLGYGIPIIKRFAEESGGVFSMSDNGGRVTVSVVLPAAPADPDSGVTLRQPPAPAYATGVPDIVEIKMREVAEFFGEAH